MAWVWLSLLGLGVETAVIIVLGLPATAGWQPGDPQVPGVTGSSSAVVVSPSGSPTISRGGLVLANTHCGSSSTQSSSRAEVAAFNGVLRGTSRPTR